MDLENITINSFLKDSFYKCEIDNIRHLKNMPMLSIVQSTEGYYEFGLNGAQRTNINEGGFFIAPAFADQDIVHHASFKTGLMSARWVFLDIILNNTHTFDSIYECPIFPDNKTSAQFNDIFEELFKSDDIIESKILCYRLAKILLNISSGKKKSNPYISSAINYIHLNYKKQLSVSEIAYNVGISPSRLYALFHEYLKVSPIAYLNQLRLSKACLLLENSDKLISEIAEECGVNDVFYFSKIFKNKHGISPREYRKVSKL